MALGDVGGFHDGMVLLVSLFISPISAVLYENDLLNGKIFTKSSTVPKQKDINRLAYSIRES